jgi:hypothetical protein
MCPTSYAFFIDMSHYSGGALISLHPEAFKHYYVLCEAENRDILILQSHEFDNEEILIKFSLKLNNPDLY